MDTKNSKEDNNKDGSYPRLNPISRLIIVFIVGVFLLPLVIVVAIIYQQTPGFNNDAMNDQFVAMIGKDVELNHGIIIGDIAIHESTNPGRSFIVTNNTDEVITFRDTGYGLRVFTIDLQGGWYEVSATKFVPLPLSLPPSSQTALGDVPSGVIYFDDLPEDIFKIRLYVSGVGDTTNTIYGAYKDLSIPH